MRRGKSGFSGGAEGAGDSLVKSRSEHGAADGRFRFSPRECLDAFAECRQRVGKSVVAVDARNLFNQVDFAFEIETPTGEHDLPSRGLRGMGGQSAAECGEKILHRGRR